MYIQLEQTDYDTIGEMISNCQDVIDGYITYNDLIDVYFSKEMKKHQEIDYYNGTGAWVVDDVIFSLNKIDSGDLEVHYNEKHLIETIKDWLWEY